MTDRSTVLVTGASGLVGTWLRRLVPPTVDVVSLAHRTSVDGRSVTVDLRDEASTRSVVAEVAPDMIVHAAAARDQASIVDATGHLAEAAATTGAGFVYLSTEAVFAGDGVARDESAVPDPQWDYGRWKAAAESLVRSAVPTAAIVRLPLVASLDPPDNIVSRIASSAADGGTSTWFVDEFRQVAHVAELATAIWAIAGRRPDGRAGVWHLPGPERLPRSEIARRSAIAAGLPLDSIISEESPAGSDRPRDLHLSADRAIAELGWSPRLVHEAASAG